MSQEAKHEWLKTVKAGDEVAVVLNGWGRVIRLLPVERCTTNQIILPGSRRFWRKDGRKVGSYYREHLEQVTSELRDEMSRKERHRAAMAIVSELTSRHYWCDLEVEQLEKLAARLQEVLAPPSPEPKP